MGGELREVTEHFCSNVITHGLFPNESQSDTCLRKDPQVVHRSSIFQVIPTPKSLNRFYAPLSWLYDCYIMAFILLTLSVLLPYITITISPSPYLKFTILLCFILLILTSFYFLLFCSILLCYILLYFILLCLILYYSISINR